MVCLFSIFLECAEWTLDPYWKDIFKQCSTGKFPKGLRMMKDGSLVVFYGKTKDIIYLNDDPKTIFQIMIKIFKEKLGLMSDRDVKKQHDEITELKETLKEGFSGTWKQIKPKNTRNTLLLNFVIDCQKIHNLSQKTSERLISVIHAGFIFKSITSDDIDYSDGIIHNIKGLTFDDKGEFNLNIYNISEEKSEKSSSDSNKMSLVLERYIKDYKSQVIKT